MSGGKYEGVKTLHVFKRGSLMSVAYGLFLYSQLRFPKLKTLSRDWNITGQPPCIGLERTVAAQELIPCAVAENSDVGFAVAIVIGGSGSV